MPAHRDRTPQRSGPSRPADRTGRRDHPGESSAQRRPVPGTGRPAAPVPSEYEAECLVGLEEFARAELLALLGPRAPVRPGPRPGTLVFRSRIDPHRLLELGMVASIYRVHRFPVPRPRALLGEEHLTHLLRLIREVVAAHPPGAFRSFRFSAAGAASAVFTRLAQVLEQRTGLTPDAEDGDLLLRFRPADPLPPEPDLPDTPPGIDLLLRVTPRPLATRPWRVCNLPGALNATIARAMASLTAPAAHDRFLNLACGSGTLMVERLALAPARVVLGIDRDAHALDCARQNLAAAGHARRAALLRCDAGRLPLHDASVTSLCADLPYGMLMGSRGENERLYPALLTEASRVAVPGAVLALITHATGVLNRALDQQHGRWAVERSFEVQVPFRSGILTPRVLQLRRTRQR